MYLALKDGLAHTKCQDDIIFLDLAASRYFALPRQIHASFDKLVTSGLLNEAEHAEIAAVLGAGYLCESQEPPCRRYDMPDRIETELVPHADAAGLMDIALALQARAKAAFMLRWQSLHSITHALKIRKHETCWTARSLDDAARIARAFGQIAPFLRSRDQCLPISLALMLMLLARSIPATMIIGVRTHPFGAHCWIQLGGLLINEQPDRVAGFAPILVI